LGTIVSSTGAGWGFLCLGLGAGAGTVAGFRVSLAEGLGVFFLGAVFLGAGFLSALALPFRAFFFGGSGTVSFEDADADADAIAVVVVSLGSTARALKATTKNKIALRIDILQVICTTNKVLKITKR